MKILSWIVELPRWQKQAVIFTIDMILVAFATWLAFYLRTGQFGVPHLSIPNALMVTMPLAMLVFLLSGVYRTIFRYAGLGMMRALVRAVMIYTLFLLIIFGIVTVPGVPRTVGFLQPIILLIFIVSLRASVRYLMIEVLGRRGANLQIKRYLIYGAGDRGQEAAVALRNQADIEVAGYLDDDKRLHGQKLDGRPVYWSGGDIGAVLAKEEVSDIVLALPRISRQKRAEIIGGLEQYKLAVKTLPKLSDIVEGNVTFSDIRPLEIEDLLGRDPVQPNELLLGSKVAGKTVLVTGAGGSIGGELCRQILAIGAKRLLMLEISEFALYSVEQELRDLSSDQDRPSLEIIPLLGSITNRSRLAQIFDSFAIDTVYHAAAYKHVPIVEGNPIEAIGNNVLGTWRLAQAARDGGVKDFILVSTDKAVRPTNIMGASKRAAEQILQAFDKQFADTRFSMVRFGNVLGSSGSVVPLFRRQIEEGGPITLTHRDITRYFMTIPEAASLVIQAGGMAQGGEVFVLDMGSPVRIENLARTMVQLSGLSLQDENNPDGDISIEEIGLRPGEKLYEELLIGDNPAETRHPRIMTAFEEYLEMDELMALMADLEECRDGDEAVALLAQLVPEFTHLRDNEPALYS